MKLTKIEIKEHKEIEKLLKQDKLIEKERDFIYDHFLPHNITNNAQEDGSFFTPQSISGALAAMCDCDGSIVIDLAAGIGSLSYGLISSNRNLKKLICVEKNENFIEIGKKLLPEAIWICGDIYAESTAVKLKKLKADWVISNPPYGLHLKKKEHLKYCGSSDLMAVEVATSLAPDSMFIIPMNNVPFTDYKTLFTSKNNKISPSLRSFMATHQHIKFNSVSVDMSVYEKDWRDGIGSVELVHLTNCV